MRRMVVTAVATVFFAGATFQANAASLITDGGFENGDLTTAWTVTNSGGCCVEAQTSGLGFGPNSGSWFAEIGTTNLSSISQTFADTAGHTLAVSFFYASNGDLNPIPPD